MHISGRTRVVVHLAYPARHLRTPEFFNPLVEKLGYDAVLVPWEVPPDDLARAWEGLKVIGNLAGVIVTVPHKQAVATLCDELVGTARTLNVCNVARRLPDGRFTGRMFDGDGFVRGLKNEAHDPVGKSALLLGAGGAATGIAHGLLAAGVSKLTINNRTPAKADELVASLRHLYAGQIVEAGPADGRGYDLVVNGTALGLKAGDALPLPAETLDASTLVAEVVMNPDVTPLLAEAKARGCAIHKGVHMITGQVELVADFLLAENPA
jgi:shikimate dehydrogenase